MIRAVPFQYYLSGRVDSMAFISTVTDTFYAFADDQHWESWDDLEESMDIAGIADDDPLRDRLRGLCPMWFIRSKGY